MFAPTVMVLAAGYVPQSMFRAFGPSFDEAASALVVISGSDPEYLVIVNTFCTLT